MFLKIRAFFAYLIAVAAILFMAYAFVGMNQLEKIIVATGLHPTYWYSGGEQALIVRREGYEVIVNRPVFKTVFGDASEGFVQFRLIGRPKLPNLIDEKIAIDGYSFAVAVDTKELSGKLTASDGYAERIKWVNLFSDKSVAVRVTLKHKH